MVIDFLNVVYAAHLSSLDAGVLDTSRPSETKRARRLAGVDIQKPRMRAVTEAMLSLAPAPGGFTVGDLAAKTRALWRREPASYTPRHAAYDLRKLRGKALVDRVGPSRRYHSRFAESARWRPY